MRIFEFANTALEKAKARLMDMHACLNDLLIKDELDLEKAKRDTTVVEVAIRHANDQAVENIPASQVEVPQPGQLNHPFLANLNIDEAHKAGLEDL